MKGIKMEDKIEVGEKENWKQERRINELLFRYL